MIGEEVMARLFLLAVVYRSLDLLLVVSSLPYFLLCAAFCMTICAVSIVERPLVGPLDDVLYPAPIFYLLYMLFLLDAICYLAFLSSPTELILESALFRDI
jgi:hypothetical protein